MSISFPVGAAREGVVAEYFSPHFKDFPDWALPAHHKWTSARANL